MAGLSFTDDDSKPFSFRGASAIFAFASADAEGGCSEAPDSGAILDSAGKLYGITTKGDTNDGGVGPR